MMHDTGTSLLVGKGINMERAKLSAILTSVLLLISAFGVGCQAAPNGANATPPVAATMPRVSHVVIISLDGGKPAVMQQSNMPVLTRMVNAGAVSWQAQTVFPSITLVSHTSMLTGVGPDKHKVTWNDWLPEKGLVTVPTVFQLAKQHGLSTALFAAKEKFLHLAIPGTLDNITILAATAKPVAEAAATYIKAQKPALCFIHFADSDTAGHAFGWGSPQQIAAFGDEDAALGIVLDALQQTGIADDTVVIVTADHGGHDRTHGTASPEDMTIPWIAYGRGVRKDFKIATPVVTYDTAATALWLLGIAIPVDWDGKPVTSAFETFVPKG
jgi:predicted AlkP superfamily pyrophosphatase or phosphodiesterase